MTTILSTLSSSATSAASSSVQADSSLGLPAVCYSTCNDAYIDALKTGKTPALCASGSSFQDDYSSCEACVAVNSENFRVASQSYIEPQFGPFIQYCISLDSSSVKSGVVESTAASITLSDVSTPSSLSYFTTLSPTSTSSHSGSPYTTITTINTQDVPLFNGSTITVTLTNLITLWDQSVSTSSSSATNSQSALSPGHAQFHGLVFGSTFGGLSVVVFSCWIYWKFWRHQHLRVLKAKDTAGDENGCEKAQLHSESLRPKDPEELDEAPKGPVAELPAVEPVGTELSGNVNATESLR